MVIRYRELWRPCADRALLPTASAITTGTGAESLHGRDVDVRSGKPRHHVGHRAWPVVTLNQKTALLGTQLEPRSPGCLREDAAIFGDEVQLRSARTVRERRDTDQADASFV